MAEGIAFSFLGKISEYLVAPIGRQFGYVLCYNRNIEKVRRQAEELEAKRRGLQLSVDAANNNCQVIRPDVELWLKNEDEKKDKANSILLEKEKVGKGCLNEWCLNLKSCYWLSRKATKIAQDVIDLLAKGNFQTVSFPPPALGKVPISVDDKKKTQLADEFQIEAASSATSVPDLENATKSTSSSGGFESRLSVIRDIMEAVRDENIHTAGICGMGGVGKTTMVQEVANRAREERLFDEIATVVVSQEPDVTRIQRDIADFLKLELKEQNVLARASRLHERLTQKGSNDKPKRILIILDELWTKLDLNRNPISR